MLQSKRVHKRLDLRLLIGSISESVIINVSIHLNGCFRGDFRWLSKGNHFLTMPRAFLCPAGPASRVRTGRAMSAVTGRGGRGTALFPDTTERPGDGCLRLCKSLEAVGFSAGSQLVAIGEIALRYGSLHRLAGSDGVERLGRACFGECESLEGVGFGAGSRLVEVGRPAFRVSSTRRIVLPPRCDQSRPKCAPSVQHRSLSAKEAWFVLHSVEKPWPCRPKPAVGRTA